MFGENPNPTLHLQQLGKRNINTIKFNYLLTYQYIDNRILYKVDRLEQTPRSQLTGQPCLGQTNNYHHCIYSFPDIDRLR